jgi:hypothetical protein
MRKLATAAAIAALLGVSATASAWWGGGPWGGNSGNDWWNDMMGDGYGDFNMAICAQPLKKDKIARCALFITLIFRPFQK